MKNILVSGLASLVVLASAAATHAQSFDPSDPDVCGKVAEAMKSGDADLKAEAEEMAPKLQAAGVCSADLKPL
jgi:Skp family chaperone for outer membrane proteins